MKNFFGAMLLASTLVVGSAMAAPIVLTGSFLQVSISDRGTFGQNGGGRPAFVHDITGTGTFDLSTDYIAPGSPHDGFSLVSDQFGFTQNNNNGVSGIGFTSPVLLTGAAARGYLNAASWTGTVAGLFTITNSYFFNAGDERVLIETTVTALQDLTSLAFARSVDPDSGTTSSINQRGNISLAKNDFIGSESTANGRTLAIINVRNNGFANATQIGDTCCNNINPNIVLAGPGFRGDSSTGDHSLNMAYRLGTLANGASATFQYSYAAGLGIDKITPTGAVPESSTWMMMIVGFGAAGSALRLRRRKSIASLA